jgi:hypothetical protein
MATQKTGAKKAAKKTNGKKTNGKTKVKAYTGSLLDIAAI